MIEEVVKLNPEKEIVDGDYRWFVFPEEVTGLRMVGLEDLVTGVVTTTTLANPSKRTAAHRAWQGARHSRAFGDPWEIAYEMGEKGVDPDQKLEETFNTYGHKSVGDMARIEVDVTHCPMHLCYSLFNEGALNAGQEKSSRYQSKFGAAVMHPLENYMPAGTHDDSLEEEYQSFGNFSLELFAKHKEAIGKSFEDHFKPTEKSEFSALTSRTLDCVRFFLLFGVCSGLSYETSARDWARTISEMNASHMPFYGRVAAQIEKLLTPSAEIETELKFKAEAPSLIRHTDPASTTNDSLKELRDYIETKSDFAEAVPINKEFRGQVGQKVKFVGNEYSAADKMVAQYILLLWPGADKDKLLDWVKGQSKEQKKEISRVVFAGHDHNHELPMWAGTTDTTLIFESSIGEVRDWNRHRAWARFVPLPLLYGQSWNRDTADQVLARGFLLPLYLSEVPDFKQLADDFSSDMEDYYRRLRKFVDKVGRTYGDSLDYSFIVNLLPLGHQMDIWMHGNPKQDVYLTFLRRRPGGHINYRALAFEANQYIADSDPYLEGLRLDKKPDPSNRQEFFDRS